MTTCTSCNHWTKTVLHFLILLTSLPTSRVDFWLKLAPSKSCIQPSYCVKYGFLSFRVVNLKDLYLLLVYINDLSNGVSFLTHFFADITFNCFTNDLKTLLYNKSSWGCGVIGPEFPSQQVQHAVQCPSPKLNTCLIPTNTHSMIIPYTVPGLWHYAVVV